MHAAKHGSKRFVLAALGLLACGRDVETGRRCAASEPDCTTSPRVQVVPPAAAGNGASGDGATAGGDAEPDDGRMCVKNPSFEGALFPGVPPEWTICSGSPDVNPTLSVYPASDGETYIALGASANAALEETIEATLCAPMQAGVPLPFSVDLSISGAFGPFGAASIQLWGASTSCTPDELLWESPLLVDFDQWTTYCGTLLPAKAYAFLILVPAPPPGDTVTTGYLIVDNFGSAGACH